MSYAELVAAGKAKAAGKPAADPKKPVQKSEKTKARIMRERTEVEIPDRYINMSNALARSAQGLSLSEKRIVSLALAKTDSLPLSNLIAAGRDGWTIKVTAAEYSETFEVSADTAYDQLQAGAKHLRGRYVKTLKNTRTGIIETDTNWCGRCSYHRGEAWIEVAFTPQIAPHLLGLRTQFTSYKLKQASALRSIYSWRLFECLQSWKKTGVWRVSIVEFCEAMDAPASTRADFGRLRVRILEPAIKELRDKDGFEIEAELEKAGRKVTGIVFKFRRSAQGRLDMEPSPAQGKLPL